MNRLELLKQELEILNQLQTLSFEIRYKAQTYFKREIEAIEKYGSENKEVEE